MMNVIEEVMSLSRLRVITWTATALFTCPHDALLPLWQVAFAELSMCRSIHSVSFRYLLAVSAHAGGASRNGRSIMHTLSLTLLCAIIVLASVDAFRVAHSATPYLIGNICTLPCATPTFSVGRKRVRAPRGEMQRSQPKEVVAPVVQSVCA